MRRHKNLMSKAFAGIMALVMVVGMILPGAKTAEAANELQVAQYVKTTEGDVTGTAGSNQGTYAGEWKASIPMADVMSAFESQMEKEAKDGHFPWNIEDVDSSAYIYYNVTFPDGVTVGTPVTSSTTNIIPAGTISNSKTETGNTVKFKFKLADVNWQQIYDYYKADRASGTANHTVNVTIPYTVKADSYKEAQELETKTVDSTGEFSFYPSRTWGKFGAGKQTFKADTAKQPLAANITKSNVFAKPASDNVRQTVDIDADLKLGNDTGNQTIKLKKTDKMDFVGVINAKTIKDQMANIEASYSADAEKIALSNLTTSFTARLALPKGLSFTSKDAVLEGANGSFVISKIETDDQSAEVTFKLVDDDKIDSFAKLRAAVNKVDDELKVTFKTAQFDNQSKGNTDYEVTGGITGSLVATATNTESLKQINFHLIWNGKQTQAGESVNNPGQIALSVRYDEPTEGNFEATKKLPGDILVGDETEHTQVYEVEEGSKVAFTGSLDVSPVKEQLKQVEDQFNKSNLDPKKISLSNYSSSFVAKLTLPNELDFDGTPSVSLLNDNGKYKIVKSEVSGKTITVTMTVNANVTSFAELKDAVLGMDDQLKVVVNGAVFNSQAKPNTNYTVRGSMTGDLQAKATNSVSGKVINFKLHWDAEQLPEGADAINPTSKDITFTLKYKAKPSEQEVTGSDDMDADLLVNGDTQHDRVYEASKSDPMEITGRLDVTKIKDRLKQLEAQYESSSVPTNIAVSELETSFTAVLELPDQLAYTENPQISLRKVNDKFKITSSKIEGNKLTVVMSLKNQASSFKDIKEAVEGVEDQLDVVVNGVKFKDTAKADTNYTIKGTVTGNFKAKATNLLSGKVIRFSYTWNAKQMDGGQDFTNLTSQNITLTVKYKETVAPEPEKPIVTPDKPIVKPDKPSVKPTAPKTGDQSQLPLYAGIALGVVALSLLIVAKKKKSDQ